MRVKALIAYDGTAYYGWQVQRHYPTIQSTIEKCLEHICRKPVAVTGAGRTDSGVHAYEQVAHFDWDHPLAVDKVALGLNALLPPDIRILQLSEVDPEFHARFAAKSKIYVYRILRSRFHSPFELRYSLHYPHFLDETLLQQSGRFLEGEHDFMAFQATGTDVVSTVRTIHGLEVFNNTEKTGKFVYVRIHSTGFLRKMARFVVGTMLEIATGKRGIDDLPQALQTQDRKYVGIPVPARGLFLEKVNY